MVFNTLFVRDHYFVHKDVYKSAFPKYSFTKLVFSLSVFCVFCLCLEFEVIFTNFYSIFLIIIYIGTKYSVILFSPEA